MRCLTCSVLQCFSRWCCADLNVSVLHKYTMALNERACRGKRGGEGLADLDEGDRQCTCPLTREEIESIVLKKDPDTNLFGWKCPTCKHDFAAHATGNFHIPRSKLSWIVHTFAKVILLFAHRCNPCPCDRYVYCIIFTSSSICSACILLVWTSDECVCLVWTWFYIRIWMRSGVR